MPQEHLVRLDLQVQQVQQARQVLPAQPDQLEAAIEAHHPRLIYIAPTHHNPTGLVMPLHRRRQLRQQQEDIQAGLVDYEAIPPYPRRPRPPS